MHPLPTLRSERFLRACRREDVDVTPIWMMRQAGRSLPRYRALREGCSFLDMISRPELMAEITLLPLEELEVDAAVMFADITLVLASLGIRFDIVESVGPVIEEPIRRIEQVERFERIPVADSTPTVLESIRLVRKELDGVVPVIGFAGAPFTLASYLIEGRPSRDFAATKAMMFGDPAAWHALMDRLTTLIIEYLVEQIRAGAQAIQLFDSWLGALGPGDVRRSVLPYTRRIFAALETYDVPRILFGTGTASLLECMADADPDVIGVDWRVDLDHAWRRIGARGIQGNLDPAVLLAPGDVVVERAREVLSQADSRKGHIFNLGHGVLPGTPVDNLKLLVDTVHGYTR
jgi:uroporphyrinogen decarboxylase